MDFTAALGAITRPFRKPEGYVSAKEEEAAAKAAAAKSTAPPPPAPSPQMGGVNLGAIRKREQAAGLKDGGVVRGPGTGTSDSIPDRVRAGTYILPADSTQDVRLSNGETKLPPEVLATIGAAAVEALRNVTHERAETAGEGAGEESEDDGEAPMFKDGGCVGLGAKRKRYADGGMVDDEPVPDRAVFGLYPQLAGGKRTTYATDQALRTGVIQTGLSSFEQAPPSPVVQGLKMDLPAGVAPSTAGAGRGAVNPALAVPSAVAPGANPATTNPTPVGTPATPTVAQPSAPASPTTASGMEPAAPMQPGTTSADNIAAMQRTGAIYRQMAQLPLQQNNLPAGYGAVIPPDRQEERNRRFDLEVMRERGIQAGGRAGRDMVAAAMSGLNQMGGADAATARQNADAQAAFTRETAETGRNTDRLAVENRRLDATAGESAARGALATQQASDLQRIARLQAKYETTTDPEQRKQLREQILLAQGRDTAMPNRFTVIPGGQTVDPTTGQVVREPSQVLDNQTGQLVRPGGAQQKPKFETNKVYEDAKGNRAKWDGTKFVPA